MSAAAPKIRSLLEAALYVDDVDRAVAFYRDVLGLAPMESDDRITALDAGSGRVLLLCRRGASAVLPKTAHDGQGRQHVAFAIAAEELPIWEAALAERGVEVVLRKRWAQGGASLYFRDPDGHLLELATPGVWPNG